MKILETTKITDEKFLNLFKTKADNDGNLVEWVWASRAKDGTPNSISAVVVVPIDVENRQLIMIEEFRIPIGDYEWSFPAGLLEPGENPVDAAKRELEEETGYLMTKLLCVSPPIYSSSGLSDESISLVFVECKTGGKQNLESSECLHVRPIGHLELNSFLFSDKKISAKAWSILYGFIAKSPFPALEEK